MPPSEGGVFISTEQIYDLLRQSIDQTNERLTEIRSDIRSMNDQNNETRRITIDHETRIREIEKTKKDRLPPSIVSALIAAPIAVLGIVVPIFVK